MALTVSNTKRNSVSGSKITAYVTVAFDASYPTGGEAFDATTYIANPDSILVSGMDSAGHIVRYDETNKKLKVYQSGHAALDGAAAIANAAAAPLVEVANTTDLALLGVELIITGSRA
tara:strand:- start:6235 stop:6588 length:354 start_codon:yes stop_codon:yes gene_type:complete